MTNHPKHARPRGKRGNKYTPWIHIWSILISFFIVKDFIVYPSVQPGHFLATTLRVFGAWALVYVVTVIVVAGACIAYDESKKRYAENLIKKL